MGITGFLNHTHSGWEDFAKGEQIAHDEPIFHQLPHCFHPGDILSGDRAFCRYELIPTLREKDVHTVMRLHQARHGVLDRRKENRLGKHQRQVSSKKPAFKQAGSTMTAVEWKPLPNEMEVRLIRFYSEGRNEKCAQDTPNGADRL